MEAIYKNENKLVGKLLVEPTRKKVVIEIWGRTIEPPQKKDGIIELKPMHQIAKLPLELDMVYSEMVIRVTEDKRDPVYFERSEEDLDGTKYLASNSWQPKQK